MAARPIWRGQIRLALVSIPVELFPATKSGAQIQFHQVHEPSGKRIKYEKVVPGIGPVDRDEIVKGYEVSKGHYVLLDPEEIDSVKLESRKTLDLVQFVDEARSTPCSSTSLITRPGRRPRRGSLCRPARCAEGREEGRRRPARDARPGICRRAEAVRPRACCSRRCATPTRSTNRRASSATLAITKPDPDLLDMASMLIERKAGEFDPTEFHNRYVDALHRLIEEKQKAKGEKIIEDPDADAPPPKGSNVIDLMAALKKSLGDEKRGKAGKGQEPAAKSRRRQEGTRRRRLHVKGR